MWLILSATIKRQLGEKRETAARGARQDLYLPRKRHQVRHGGARAEAGASPHLHMQLSIGDRFAAHNGHHVTPHAESSMPWALSSEAAASEATREAVRRYHSRRKGPGQCRSVNVQFVAAPVEVVWSLVRRFDRPQEYKLFVRGCALREGDGGVGSVREVEVASGLPASSSTERLDALDDERRVMSFSIVGGDHRLRNYRATTSLHGAADWKAGAIVVESYVVDVPPGNTEEDTIVFADTIVRCNLRSLACVAEGIAGAGGR